MSDEAVAAALKLSDMKAADIEESWERAANTRDEITASQHTGRLQYHPIRNEDQ